MQSSDRYSFKNSSKKIAHAVIFLLGFFVFSDLAISPSTGPVVVQTTLVSYANSGVVQGYPYSVKSGTAYKQHAAVFLSAGILYLSRFHSKLTHINLKQYRGTTSSKPYLSNFCLAKVIPQSGKIDAHPILG
ncbi:hypothetical protein HDF24_23490 [Mucilaginibacter sp. X4EP1]|uniref:hypothetical protein n=1 Tax=Mucilaginibacter sp. X4EP1 TaxID=2723092 RepID=UPI00216A44C7|nr:hypothetical protein [Mucilaginibacter sp. X4EP1]MCS3815897.1 hypothetical protein [Mucilaginibacter sp. X4EP1]